MSKFYLKPAVLSVAMVLLTACQHTPDLTVAPTTTSVIPPSAKVFFDETSPSAIAKAQFVKAINEYLLKERHTVSTHYSQVMPLYADDSPNKNADPFWGSFVKVQEFRRNHQDINHQPYRTESEYLDEGMSDDVAMVDLPYLRYHDQDNQPTVDRTVAMTDDTYLQVNHQINGLVQATNETISDLDDEILSAIAARRVSEKDETGKNILSSLNQLKKEHDAEHNELKKSAQGYQIQDLNDTKACLGDYETGVRELLKKSISASDEQTVQLLYQNYTVCAVGYGLNKTITPATYIANGYTEHHLNVTKDLLTCQKQAIQGQRALRASGRTYANDDKAYLDNYVDFAKCAGEHLGVDDEIVDFESAKYAIYPMRNVRDYGEFDEYHTRVDKYQGLSGWLQAYRDMKQYGQNTDNKPNDELSVLNRFGIYGSMMASMLDYIKQTPEQLTAKNLYQYNNTTITSLSHHNPANRQATILWSLDFESPTARQSAQLPIQADFGTGVVNADVSALLPLAAAIAPKYAPLPKDVPNGQMYFKAPHELAQKIPSHVIYDAISRGVVVAIKELDSESFTPVAGQDDFAKQIRASHTIKIHLSTKQMGEMYATIAKTVVQDLNAYVDANPDIYPDIIATKNDKNKGIKKGEHTADIVKKAIKDFATLTMAHRSSDVGGLLQAIEGFLPFSMNTASYVYLSADGKLLGSQSVMELRDELHDYRLKNITQTRHDKAFFDSHVLSGQFYQAFSEPASVDGVALIKSSVDDYRFKKTAQSVRQEYAFSLDAVSNDDTSNVSNLCMQNTDNITETANDDVRQMAEAFKQKECSTRQYK